MPFIFVLQKKLRIEKIKFNVFITSKIKIENFIIMWQKKLGNLEMEKLD